MSRSWALRTVFGVFVQILAIFGVSAQNFGQKCPEKTKKSKNQKSVRWLHLSYVGGPPYPFLAQTDYPVAQKIEWRGKSGSRFWRFSYTNGRKQPKTTLL